MRFDLSLYYVLSFTINAIVKHDIDFVKSNLGNKRQWNFDQNSNNVIQENTFDNAVCKLSAILCWPQYVNPAQPHTISVIVIHPQWMSEFMDQIMR